VGGRGLWAGRGGGGGGGRGFVHSSRLALGPIQLPVQWVPGSSPVV
jgi:hypothetical protein